jgi:hypothetical protein
MHIAIVTAQGFNELDSFIALGILNRVKRNAWRVSICAPSDTVTSMNGVTVNAQSRLADARPPTSSCSEAGRGRASSSPTRRTSRRSRSIPSAS